MISDSAKIILCYGDSNTWGYNPSADDRFPRSVRWTGALQRLLGDEYEVISEGLCGRAFVAEDPKKPHRTGITHLQSIVESADPADLVMIMLGTNDIMTTYNLSPEQIAEHLQQTVDLIRNPKLEIGKQPKILIICPPPVIFPANGELDKRMVDGPQKCKVLPDLYESVAKKNGCEFIDAGKYTSFGTVDGYHFDESGHRKLAETLASWIQKM
jgi:lysophospholipase L1-like esterase